MAYVKLDENGVIIQKQPYFESGFIESPDSVVCGMILENGEYVNPPAPPPSVPQSCTRRQGRLALLGVGKLDLVESAIAAIEDPTERMAAQIEYEADTWERGNAFLQAMWAQLGGTEQQLDDLFREAVTL